MPKGQLPAKYYWQHFHEFLMFIEQGCWHLLEQNQQDYIARFKQLPEDSQCLMVRMFNRKGLVFNKRSLSYAEINHLPQQLHTLHQQGFVEPLQQDHLKIFIQSLNKQQLLTLFTDNQHHFLEKAPNKSANKLQWQQYLMAHLNFQWIASSDLVTANLVIKQPEVFQYLLFLYFGHVKGQLKQFSLRDLGILNTRHKATQNQHQARFAQLSHAQSAFYYAHALTQLTLLNRQQLLKLAQQVDQWPLAQGTQAQKSYQQYLFEVGKTLEDEQLKLQLWQLSNHPAAIEKRIRLLYQLGEIEQVKQQLETQISQPASEQLLIFAQDFYERKFNKKRTSVLTDLLRNGPPAVSLDQAHIGQVESAMVSHYRQQGKLSFRSENQLWRALFALTFWQELFENSLITEFDLLPQALTDNQFYEIHNKNIHARLSCLKSQEAFKQFILKQFNLYHGQANGLFSWHQDLLNQLLILIKHSEPTSLHHVLLTMSQNFQNLKDGYPDLLLIDDQQLRFEEIKAPGDQLRRNQLVAIELLKQAGFNVCVQAVRWQVNPQQIYTVVDIETTGGGHEHHRITEVAMVKLQGNKILDRWQSLINPQRHIPAAITQLTGIDNHMVAQAPCFAEVAKQIHDFCQHTIFVAHNVNFDYGFLKREFARVDTSFSLAKLCTVRLARKHLPGLASYSLGKLCRDLEIELENHHRAMDDAMAAAKILMMVNEKRLNESI